MSDAELTVIFGHIDTLVPLHQGLYESKSYKEIFTPVFVLFCLLYFDDETSSTVHFYRLRSRGDNTFGSARVCACVCPSVYLWTLSSLNHLTFGLDFWHEGRP